MRCSTPDRFRFRYVAAALVAATIPCMLTIAPASAATSPAPSLAAWRETIARTPTPAEGCFTADFPATSWTKTSCSAAPVRPYLPRHGRRGYTVGNGNDYAAVTSTLTASAIGSFPAVSGVKTENDGGSNVYSLQLNSGFMNTAGCNGSSNPAQCLTWEQFVYSSSSQAAFMQYWLINYGNTCPDSSWNSYQGSCYKNSAAVSVPKIAATQLGGLKISAAAVSGGIDTLIMTTPTKAYSTTGRDSVVYLATAWTQSEFNVVGDGGGSAAKFNKGASLTVEIALKDGSTSAPTCEGGDGTTGETNNLTLGGCSVAGGSTPAIEFTEKR